VSSQTNQLSQLFFTPSELVRIGPALRHRAMAIRGRLAPMRAVLRDVGIGVGLAALFLFLALALWPHTGVSGTVTTCKPMVGQCQVEPVAAGISVRHSCDSGGGILTPATPADNRTWETKSDNAGHFHLDLPPGSYCLYASWGWGQGRASFEVVAGQVTQIHVYQEISGGICLAATDRIATPTGPVPVAQLRPGMIVWTQDGAGRRVAAHVLRVSHNPAPRGHHVVRLVLSDGRTVEASPGHPTADGRRVGELRPGDLLDGSRVKAVERVSYIGDTWDLLPAGPTGDYWADDVLLGSTLWERSD
jgi:hypothetical protein